MKLNKLITSILAFSMVASSVVSVSAAFDYMKDEESGMVIISEMPTEEEVKSRTPKLSVNVEKLNNSKMASVDAVYNTLYAKKTNTDGEYLYDIYRITYTFTNIGDLAVGYLEEAAGLGVSGVTVKADFGETASKVKYSKAKSSTIPTFSNQHGFDGNAFAYMNFTTTQSNPYPFYGDSSLGAIDSNPTITLTGLYVLDAGTSAEFNLYDCSVSYTHVTGSIQNNIPVSVTLPEQTTYKLGNTTIPATAIKLDKTELALDLNGEKTGKITATVEPTNTTDKVVWESKDKTIATVDENGNVTAVAKGETIITATIGKLDPVSCKVTVAESQTKKDQTVIEGDFGGKTLIRIGKIFKNALSNSYIAVKNETTGATKTSSQTIAEILGGETVGETTIDVEITVGVLTDTASDVFSFGLLN